MLVILWESALALAGLSILVMAILIVRRAVLQRRQRRRARQAEGLKRRLFDWLSGNMAPASFGAPLPPEEALILMDQGRRLLNSVRGDTARRLVAVLRHGGAVAAECRRLTDGKPVERREAAAALAWFAAEDVSVHEALQRVLAADPDGAVRLAAAQALLDAGRPPPLETVVAALWGREDVPGRGLLDLFRRLAPEAAAGLRDLAAGSADARLQAVAVDALGHGGDLGAVPLLVRLVREAAAVDVRAAALRSLAALGHPGARPAVAAALGDAAWEVRAQAALCASRIGFSDMAPAIMPLLDDAEWWVRFRAGQALARFPEGRPALEAAAAGTGPQARVAQLVLAEERRR